MIYRGGPGQLAFLLHRITGVGVLLFLCAHILDTALILLGPKAYNSVIRLYRHPVFLLGEVILALFVCFHAFNGLRVILLDFWPASTRFHRGLFWIASALTLALWIPSAWWMLFR